MYHWERQDPGKPDAQQNRKGVCIKGQIAAKEEYVIINSYFKSTYLIRTKEGVPDYKIKGGTEKDSFKSKKLIKSNNHSELVITSDNAL